MNLLAPTYKELLEAHLDISAPIHGVQVQSSADGKTLWVNVDEVCVLRVCRIPALLMHRPVAGFVSHGTETGRISRKEETRGTVSAAVLFSIAEDEREVQESEAASSGFIGEVNFELPGNE